MTALLSRPPTTENEGGLLDDAVWLYSYADLVTQLLLFVILTVTVTGLANFGKEKPDELDAATLELARYVKQQQLDQAVAIDRSANRLVIRLNNVLLFPPGQATLTPVAEDVIGSVVGILSRIEAPIRVEGHTDNVPIRTPQYPSNWELSTARAIAVVDFLEGRGIARARLSAAGYAEFHAIAANDSEAHRALNRRVELVVIGGGT